MNEVTDIEVDPSAITISILPRVEADGFRTHLARSARMTRTESQHILVQGLGIQGRALRYDVAVPQFTYNENSDLDVTFPWPVAGISLQWRVTHEVLAKAAYLQARGQTPEMVAELLHHLYAIEADVPTVHAWLAVPAQRALTVKQTPILLAA